MSGRPTRTDTDDLRIARILPLVSPVVLMEERPLPSRDALFLAESRRAIEEVLFGDDPRLLVVVGPCSIHDPAAALEYGRKLRAVADDLADALLVVMRVYFEKPRTVVGWKGLINDPGLDESYRINDGLRKARGLLLDLLSLGVPAGTEFLDTTLGQFYADTVSWGAIGARTAESQVHRELASGLSMPVGIKNRTDGDIAVAIDAIRAARHRHLFPSLTKDGAPAILETCGNEACHIVLRGGATGPNYTADHIARVRDRLHAVGLPEVIMVDASHGNSRKDPQHQVAVGDDVSRQLESGGSPIRGVMIESHLIGGRQDHDAGRPLVYGQSITDACLSFDDTVLVLERLAVAARRG